MKMRYFLWFLLLFLPVACLQGQRVVFPIWMKTDSSQNKTSEDRKVGLKDQNRHFRFLSDQQPKEELDTFGHNFNPSGNRFSFKDYGGSEAEFFQDIEVDNQRGYLTGMNQNRIKDQSSILLALEDNLSSLPEIPPEADLSKAEHPREKR